MSEQTATASQQTAVAEPVVATEKNAAKKTETVAEAFHLENAGNLLWYLIEKGAENFALARQQAGQDVQAEAERRDIDLNSILNLPANAITRREMEKIVELETKVHDAIRASQDAFSALLDRAQVLKLKQTAKQIQEDSKKRKKVHDENGVEPEKPKQRKKKSPGTEQKAEKEPAAIVSVTDAENSIPQTDEIIKNE